jgi:hypothetical protein
MIKLRAFCFLEAGLKSVLYKRDTEQDFNQVVGHDDQPGKKEETAGNLF